jgi:DNA-binding NarL/FixJ family response regulator
MHRFTTTEIVIPAEDLKLCNRVKSGELPEKNKALARERRLDMVRLRDEGISIRAIAMRLKVSINTVKAGIKEIKNEKPN